MYRITKSVVRHFQLQLIDRNRAVFFSVIKKSAHQARLESWLLFACEKGLQRNAAEY
jgi:hypothetical protein